MNRCQLGVTAAVLAAGITALTIRPASAEPATTVAYSTNASATRLSGYAFDTCVAPALDAMQAWKAASTYQGVGVYIGGVSRSCAQPNLTASWVTAAALQGWRIIPIFVGYQAPCTRRSSVAKFTNTTAPILGTADAADAVLQAQALGILPVSAIYGDVEHYRASNSTCRSAVLSYISAWTKELHRLGYLAGVYANLSSGAKHFSEAYTSTGYARLDAVWIARWDNNSSLTGWAGVPDNQWSNSQRAKQYRGDHDETYGGIKINIDSNRFDAPVATVAYPYQITSSADLNGRSAPSTSAALVRSYAPGSTVPVVCQATGVRVGTTSVWDKLADGNYVSDFYLSTPSKSTYSAPLPSCTYPFQVTTATLNKRTGPGVGYAKAGSLSDGALAWISCQRSGTKTGTSAVWDRLDDGAYMSDYYLATPGEATYSPPVPRCE